jgi:cation diffusion facilitator family transporter
MLRRLLTESRNVPRAEAAAASLSVIVSVLLMGLKFVAYHLTGSSAVFSDALESLVNVAASVVAAWSLFLAHQPPDPQHPYGHGKAEFLSAGFEGGMILLAALVILERAIEEIIQRPQIRQIEWGLVLILVAGLINGGVGLVLLRLGKQKDSATLRADGHHLLSDAITSAGVLVSLLLIHLTGIIWIDPIAAILLAGYIAYVGLYLLSHSAAGLMDRQDAADEKLISRILDSHAGPYGVSPAICSYHKLRHRHSGRYHWVDFHLVVPPHWNVARGHEVASSIEYEIEQALGEGNATAHVEPCKDEQCKFCQAQRAEQAAGSNQTKG